MSGSSRGCSPRLRRRRSLSRWSVAARRPALGGRVMKNVTGLDLCRGLAGSWGTLAVMCEVTFKVQPMPEETGTLILLGLPDEIAVEVLCEAMRTPYEVSGAVHLQRALVARLW